MLKLLGESEPFAEEAVLEAMDAREELDETETFDGLYADVLEDDPAPPAFPER